MAMEAEIWQRLPEDLLHMVLARLPMRTLGKMKTVCKQWNYLLSSRDALQINLPNWSLHSTPGFLIEIDWNRTNDMEYWVIEGRGSDIYKLPLLNHLVVDTCDGIFCCHRKEDLPNLLMGIPGTRNWRRLPPVPIHDFSFSGMTFDASTRRCTLLLGDSYPSPQGDNRRVVMFIYDSESNGWTQVSMWVPDHIQPCGKGIYCKEKFHWANLNYHLNCYRIRIVAFNIADGHWTEMEPPERCRKLLLGNLCEHDGQVVLPEVCSNPRPDCVDVHMWKLNEAEKFETWCKLTLKGHFSFYPAVTVNSNGLIIVVDCKINMSIYNSKGELICQELRLPDHHTYEQQLESLVSVSAFESNNLWWP